MRANSATQNTMPLYTRPRVESPSLWRRGIRLFFLLSLASLYGVAIAYLPQQLIVLPIVPILILLLLSLWMLPDRANFPERALFTSFNWFIILYYIWPSYIAIALPGLPWFSAGRIGLTMLLLVTLYSLSISNVLRQQILETAKTSRITWILLLTGLGAQTISLILTPAPTTAIIKFVNNLAYWILPFFVGCYIFSQSGRIEKFIKLLIGIVVFLCAIGYLEHFQQKLFWQGHIPSFLKVDDAQVIDSVFSGQMRDYIGTYRVHTTFTVALLYSELLVLTLPFVLHWMFTTRSIKTRLMMIAVWLMIVPNIIFTDTRLGKIGFIIAHIGYALMWALRARQRRSNFATTAALVAIPVISVMAIGVIFASHTLHSMVFGSEGYAGSTNARYDQISMGIPKVLHNLLGYGPGMAGQVLGYRSPGGLLTIDSQFLKTALEAGVVGLLAIYGLVAWAAFEAIRLFFTAQDDEGELSGPLAISLVIYLVIKGVLAEDYNNTLGYIWIAMVAALAMRHKVRALPSSNGSAQRARSTTART